jgi:hypothetical protein
MTNVNWERWGRATGIVFVVLFIVAFIFYGDSPKIGASTSEIVSFYDGDRSRILTAAFIFGLAVVFLLWFAAAIASALRDAGKGGWGGATIAAGAAVGTLFYVLILVGSGLAYSIAGTGDEGVISALHTLTWTCSVILSFPFALLIGAASIGLWGARLVPDWFGWVGIVGAVALLLGGTTWANDGFWAPDGAYSQWITPIVALAWTLVASGLLYMRTAPTAAPERAAIPTP